MNDGRGRNVERTAKCECQHDAHFIAPMPHRYGQRFPLRETVLVRHPLVEPYRVCKACRVAHTVIPEIAEQEK